MMIKSHLFTKIIKENIRNGLNLQKTAFSIGAKSFQTIPPNESNFQPINMAYNMFSHTDNKTGNPLIIMHGLFGSKQNWRSIAKVLQKNLSPNRTIYTVDARNHGESPHSPFHTYDHLAADLLEFIKQQNIDKVILMGHSMGGRAMMNFTLKFPEIVEKLIAVDISPVNRSQNLEKMDSLIKAMKSISLSEELPMKDARKIAVEHLSKVVDRGTSDFILLNLKKLDNGAFAWTLNLNALEENLVYIKKFPKTEKQYTGPVMFIGGTKSDFMHQDDKEKVKKWFPNATLDWVEAGHVIHFEKPTDFTNLVTNFLNSKE